jgi:hypothetical protein
VRALNSHGRQPHGHWTIDDGKNLRLFFDEFARRRNFDPLVPENWYSISQPAVMSEKVHLGGGPSEEGGGGGGTFFGG